MILSISLEMKIIHFIVRILFFGFIIGTILDTIFFFKMFIIFNLSHEINPFIIKMIFF